MKAQKLFLTLFSFILITFCGGKSFSQIKNTPENRHEKRAKVEELKIAFITTELDLTTDEAEKFWPVYNEMAKKLREEKKSRHQLEKEIRDNRETLSDNDLKSKTNAIFESEIKEVNLKKDYTEKISTIIGYKKAVKLLSLEQQFKRELLNRLNETQQTVPVNK